MVVDAPKQMLAFVMVVPTVGVGFTVMTRVAVAVHPGALVTVTVYVAAVFTTLVFPEVLPGIHK